MLIIIKLVLTMFFWGGTFVAGRLVSAETGPFSAAFWRFALASLFLLFMSFRLEKSLPKLNKSDIPLILLLGLSGIFAYNVFFFAGLKTVSAGRASLIVALNPASISLLSRLYFREPLPATRVLGIALSLCGALVVITRGDLAAIFSQGVGTGELCILGCVASWSSYTLIGKRAMRGLSPLAAVTWSCLAGAALLLPCALYESHLAGMLDLSFKGWLGEAFLAVLGTGLGFYWYYQGIKAIGPARAGIFINLVPVFAIIQGSLLLGESIDRSILLGGALAISGVYLTNRQPKPNSANNA